MKNTMINEPVAVTSMGFKHNLAAYPRRIEFRGAIYEFIDSGLRCLIQRGDRMSEVLTMSDGRSTFRLRHDNHEGNWTLLTISA
jgi:hypothetical protein